MKDIERDIIMNMLSIGDGVLAIEILRKVVRSCAADGKKIDTIIEVVREINPMLAKSLARSYVQIRNRCKTPPS